MYKLIYRVFFLPLILIIGCAKDEGEKYVEEEGDTKEWVLDGDTEDTGEWDDDKEDSAQGGNDCFEFVYPVSFDLPDESQVSVNNDEELEELLKLWYDDKEESKEGPELIYPVDVLKDDASLTIENEAQMIRLKKSCEGDNDRDDDDDKDEEDDKDDRDGDRGNHDREPCFEFVFPISYELFDGTIISGDSIEDLKEQFKAWREDNPDARPRRSLVYPVDVVYNEEQITLNNRQELQRLRRACIQDRRQDRGQDGDRENDRDGDRDNDDESCFEFVFPISYEMPDGNVISGNDRLEIREQMGNWYTDNPDSEEEPKLIFPVDVIFGDAEITLDGLQGLERLYAACQGDRGDDRDGDDDRDDDRGDDRDNDDRDQDDEQEPCFEFVYPLSLEMTDGSILTGDSREDLADMVAIWRQDNPDARGVGELVFPLDVIFDDQQITLNSKEEVQRLRRSCD